jgi:hypothetical protein
MNRKTLFYQIILDGLLFWETKELLNKNRADANNLLNVSSTFKGLKKDHFYWELNRQYSFLYYNYSPYRCDLDRVKERGILGTNDMLSYKKKL